MSNAKNILEVTNTKTHKFIHQTSTTRAQAQNQTLVFLESIDFNVFLAPPQNKSLIAYFSEVDQYICNPICLLGDNDKPKVLCLPVSGSVLLSCITTSETHIICFTNSNDVLNGLITEIHELQDDSTWKYITAFKCVVKLYGACAAQTWIVITTMRSILIYNRKTHSWSTIVFDHHDCKCFSLKYPIVVDDMLILFPQYYGGSSFNVEKYDLINNKRLASHHQCYHEQLHLLTGAFTY